MSFPSGRRSLTQPIAAAIAVLGVAAGTGCTRTLPPPQSPGAASAPTQSSDVSANRTARIYGWVSISVGAEAAVLTAITSVMMLRAQSVRDGNCDAGRMCTLVGVDANSSLGQLGGWNAAAWIVAAAGLGAGGYLLWSHPGDGGSRVGVAVDPVGTGMGLGLRSTF
jgi:predicted MFS family arabinose efflux permease